MYRKSWQGLLGENVAVCYLVSSWNVKIVAQSFRLPSVFGEIDIIASRKNKLLFVEVKTIVVTSFKVRPYERILSSVTSKQVSNIVTLSNFFDSEMSKQLIYVFVLLNKNLTQSQIAVYFLS